MHITSEQFENFGKTWVFDPLPYGDGENGQDPILTVFPPTARLGTPEDRQHLEMELYKAVSRCIEEYPTNPEVGLFICPVDNDVLVVSHPGREGEALFGYDVYDWHELSDGDKPDVLAIRILSEKFVFVAEPHCQIDPVKCIRCQKEFDILTWDVIDAEKNPDLREKILNGRLFKHECPHCGYYSIYPYLVLYYNKSRRFFIYYFDDRSYMPRVNFPPNYTLRWVTYIGELQEKILILEDGLNDVVVEYIKYELLQRHKSGECDWRMRYVGQDKSHNNLLFEEWDAEDPWGSYTSTKITYSRRDYAALAWRFLEEETYKTQGFVRVDQNWMSKHYKKIELPVQSVPPPPVPKPPAPNPPTPEPPQSPTYPIPTKRTPRPKVPKPLSELDKLRQTDAYAIQLFKDFVEEMLGGDIRRLKDYDFEHLASGKDVTQEVLKKYVSDYGHSDIAIRSNILKAIMYLIYKDTWPNLNYITFLKGYSMDFLFPVFPLFGSPIGLEYNKRIFKGLDIAGGASAEIKDRIFDFCMMSGQLGNRIVWPNTLSEFAVSEMLSRKYRLWRDYPDTFLQTLRTALLTPQQANKNITKVLSKDKKLQETLNELRTPEAFAALLRRLLLDDFLDEQDNVRSLFEPVRFDEKPLDREKYITTVNKFLDFALEFIPKRTDLIIERLRPYLQSSEGGQLDKIQNFYRYLGVGIYSGKGRGVYGSVINNKLQVKQRDYLPSEAKVQGQPDTEIVLEVNIWEAMRVFGVNTPTALIRHFEEHQNEFTCLQEIATLLTIQGVEYVIVN